jgi:hypothetical protein
MSLPIPDDPAPRSLSIHVFLDVPDLLPLAAVVEAMDDAGGIAQERADDPRTDDHVHDPVLHATDNERTNSNYQVLRMAGHGMSLIDLAILTSNGDRLPSVEPDQDECLGHSTMGTVLGALIPVVARMPFRGG